MSLARYGLHTKRNGYDFAITAFLHPPPLAAPQKSVALIIVN